MLVNSAIRVADPRETRHRRDNILKNDNGRALAGFPQFVNSQANLALYTILILPPHD
jgi:hypothetical protein